MKDTTDELKASDEPVDKENPLRLEKKKKLHDLRALGIDPYPHNFARTANCAQFAQEYESLAVGESKPEKLFQVAGRILTKRPMGKAAFFNIQDQSGNLQCYLKLEELPPADVQAFEHLDIGDIVGVSGYVFRTKKGEISLHCKGFQMLCKSLEPLPEKYHGIADIEIKYRYRHLDLITDPESRKVFITRSKIIAEVRSFLNNRGFLEVETPVLQPIYGGAAAYPFSTHHRALDMKLFLKISPELYLKRLIVGGFEKVYEINKNFRNEGIDRSHNPEFTMLEWYEAYTDYMYQLQQFEDMIVHLCMKIRGTTKFEYQGKEIDFTSPWKRLTVYDGINEYNKVNIEKLSDKEVYDLCMKNGSDMKKPKLRGEMIMELFELTVEEHLWHPTFVMDHPIEISPLTKKHRSKVGLVERFEPFAANMEIGNAYSELNDPEDQLARLKEQEAKRVVDEEAQPMDDDFIHAIDTGMPPTGGVGVGIERIVMILADRPSIRDIILFPTMKLK